MKPTQVTIVGALALGVATATMPIGAHAATITVTPGQSIQAAVNLAAAGDTVKVMPGDYTETHGGTAAVRITKSLKLVGKGAARLLPGPGNNQGILVEPANPGDPDIVGLKIKGMTVQGFPKNGIWLRHVQDFKIEKNTSIDNLENGIWPTLSANGLVKKNVSYGSEDSALWVEGAENVRVIKNELHHAPTGMEITVSKNVSVKRNKVHDNTVGVGLYHPSAAGLPPLGGDGFWDIASNDIYDNNEPNSAPPGSLSAELPPGGGVLLLGVDNVSVRKNKVTNNAFFGVSIIDYCLAVGGSSFDCSVNPPEVEPAPEHNQIVSNIVTGNGTNPPPGPFSALASDILFLGGSDNCAKNNIAGVTIPPVLPACL